jgi:hypothetical protein
METITINPQVITDGAGHEIGVFLPMGEFEKLLEELEDYEDIKTFDEAESRPNKEFIPYRQAMDEIRKGIVK